MTAAQSTTPRMRRCKKCRISLSLDEFPPNPQGGRRFQCPDCIRWIRAQPKRCSKCREVKPPDQFHTHPVTTDGLHPWCKECGKAYRTSPTGVARRRDQELKKDYGISYDDYLGMVKSQNGKCAICGLDQPSAGLNGLKVDHCHHTGRVRGLLCNKCNTGLGFLRDDLTVVLAAAAYLQEALRSTS